MLPVETLAKALTGAEASNSVAAVKYAAPTADETKVQAAIDAEVGRLHAKLSVMLSHIEGHYESQVANLKIKLASTSKTGLAIAAILAFVVGFVAGHLL